MSELTSPKEQTDKESVAEVKVDQEGAVQKPSAENSGMGKRIAKLIITLLIISMIVGSVVLYLGWKDHQKFIATPLNIPEEGLVFEIPSGRSIRAISRDMAAAGLVEYPERVEFFARKEKYASRIKAGRFQLKPGMTPKDVLELFVSGKVVQYQLRLLEGWNFKQVMDAVAKSKDLNHTLASPDMGLVMTAIGKPDEHPEGRFFPDTYHFPTGTTDVQFLKRAYRTMEKKLASIWADRDKDLPLKSPYEALILASIVEKETGAAHERPQIAGVFVRRLRKGMRLQTDPTVIYGMGDRYQGNIRRKDLRKDTPYNTYTRKGLTPTPIALPSADAIRAAVHPAAGKSLYFVSKGDGTHYFSATLKEHNRAVRKYQLKR